MKRGVIGIVLMMLLSLPGSLSAKDKAFFTMLANAKKEAGEIEPKKLMQMLDDEDELVILDVREKGQRAEGSIYVSEITPVTVIRLTRGNLEFYIDEKIKDKDSFIVTYCRSGGRGALAAKTLRDLGYKNATNLKGGLKGWARAGYPVKTGIGVTKLSND